MSESGQDQPQYSVDGRWLWNGAQWVPAGPAPTPRPVTFVGAVPGWLAIPALVLCIPVGLALTWLTRWSTSTELIASAASVLVWVSMMTAVAVTASQHQQAHGAHPTPTPSPVAKAPTPQTDASQTPPGQAAAGQTPRSPVPTLRSDVKVVHPSQPLIQATSQGGEFSIAIPAGWTINPSQDGQNFTITPSGRSEPSIGIHAAIPVSDLRATETAAYCAQSAAVDALTCSATELSYQFADSQYQWSATDAFHALVQYLTQVANAQYGTPQITQPSQTSATYEVIKQAGGSTLDDWGIIAMGYLNNPTFQVNANVAYTSLAFVTGCEASSDQVASMRPICEQALNWFRPSRAWLNNLAQRQIQSYQTEFQIIQQQLNNEQQFQQMMNRFQSNMQQMQLEEFKAMEEIDARVGDGWHAALGGEVNMQDQSGKVYRLDNGYQSYCLTNLGNVFESAGYLSQGESYGSESCDQVLTPPAP